MFCFLFFAPYARTTRYEEAFLPKGNNRLRSLRSLGLATVPPRTSSSCCLSLIKEASYTHSAEVPVLNTAVDVEEVRFSMTCSVVDGQGKRGNVHISTIMSVAFPDVVVFDGFI